MTSSIAPGEHDVRLGSLSFHYTVQGSGPPLVIQPPGWGIGAGLYKATFGPLEPHNTLIYFEPRGNAGSERPSTAAEMSSRHMVEDLELFRQHLQLETIDLLGHSSGGTVVLGYALMYPERAGKIILIDANVLGYQRKDSSFFQKVGAVQAEMKPETDERFKELLFRILDLYFHAPDKYVPALKATWTDPISMWAYGAYYGADNTPPVWMQIEELDRVKARILLLVGRHDVVCGVEISERVREVVSSSKMTVFEESGHFPWIEEEEKFFETAGKFLRE